MAREVGLTQTAVSRIWRAFGLPPHRQDRWKLSKAPHFVAKVRNMPESRTRSYGDGVGRRRPRFCLDPGGAQSSGSGFMAGWATKQEH